MYAWAINGNIIFSVLSICFSLNILTAEPLDIQTTNSVYLDYISDKLDRHRQRSKYQINNMIFEEKVGENIQFTLLGH